MKVTGWSNKVDDFVKQNKDLSQVSKDGVDIRIYESRTGILKIAIEFDEHVTSRKLMRAYSTAKKWREKLAKYQGKVFVGEDEDLLRYIDQFMLKPSKKNLKNRPRTQDQHTGYLSYREMASIINALVSDWLNEVAGKKTSIAKDIPGYTDFMFFVRGIEGKFPDPVLRSKKLLKIFRLEDDFIQIHLEEGLRRIRANKPPFLKDLPLSRKKMISVMKWYRGEDNP